MAFVEKLDPEALEFFNNVAAKKFQEQAVAFLNAYWKEVGSQAEFIYSVSWEIIKYADMHTKGISLIHKYDEGNDVDFDIGLYFYERLNKHLEEHKEWVCEEYGMSQPEMLTAIKRKKELRDKVDVNFDGRVSFLEYLLYQYREVANPADFTKRAMTAPDEHPEVRKARLALEEVNKAIQAYEAEKYRLETESEKPGIKGLKAKHELSILDNGPLKENLNVSLITAEAALRKVQRMFGKGNAGAVGEEAPMPTEGAMWWMNRDLEEKQKRYGGRK